MERPPSLHDSASTSHRPEHRRIAPVEEVHFNATNSHLQGSLHGAASRRSTHQALFQDRDNTQDLDDAITTYCSVLELLSEDHRSYLTCLRNLASCLKMRFERHGDPGDLTRSIVHQFSVIRLLPSNHPLQASSRFVLATLFMMKYGLHDDIQDLDNAISLYRDSLNLRPGGHPDRLHSLGELSISLFRRFELQGNLQDLDEVITHYREILTVLEDDHPDRAAFGQRLERAVEARLNSPVHLQGIEADDFQDLRQLLDDHWPPENDFPFLGQPGVRDQGFQRNDHLRGLAYIEQVRGERLRDTATPQIPNLAIRSHHGDLKPKSHDTPRKMWEIVMRQPALTAIYLRTCLTTYADLQLLSTNAIKPFLEPRLSFL